jgi:hypothetical protein
MVVMEPTELRTRRRRATAGITVLAGLAVLAGAALLVRSWIDELPDPVASHWGADGRPNGFSSVEGLIGYVLGLGTLLVLGFGAVTLGLGHTALIRRIGAAATVWSALFVSIITAGSLAVQRGVADARDAGDIGGVMAWAAVVSVTVAIIVSVAVPGDPRQPTRAPIDPSAPRAPLGQPAVWRGHAESRAAVLIGLAVCGLMVAAALWTRLWPLLIVAVVVFALVASMSVAVVRVDGHAVTIGSPLGWPRTRVPLDEVVRAGVIDVRPLRDFGGWGWRVGRGGRVGIVLRAGESLLVERTGGRSIAVTVDGAETAAGLVNTLADRDRSVRG